MKSRLLNECKICKAIRPIKKGGICKECEKKEIEKGLMWLQVSRQLLGRDKV